MANYLAPVPPHVHAVESEALWKCVSINEVPLALRCGGELALARLQQALEHLLNHVSTLWSALLYSSNIPQQQVHRTVIRQQGNAKMDPDSSRHDQAGTEYHQAETYVMSLSLRSSVAPTYLELAGGLRRKEGVVRLCNVQRQQVGAGQRRPAHTAHRRLRGRAPIRHLFQRSAQVHQQRLLLCR
jgi:hypothetical protein